MEIYNKEGFFPHPDLTAIEPDVMLKVLTPLQEVKLTKLLDDMRDARNELIAVKDGWDTVAIKAAKVKLLGKVDAVNEFLKGI